MLVDVLAGVHEGDRGKVVEAYAGLEWGKVAHAANQRTQALREENEELCAMQADQQSWRRQANACGVNRQADASAQSVAHAVLGV